MAQHLDATSAAIRFLHFLRDNPTILPMAPDDPTDQEIQHRVGKAHACAWCEKPAQAAYAALPVLPDVYWRWLDLCRYCEVPVRSADEGHLF